MEIRKRSLPMYVFLNCITLGIYGFIVSKQIGEEVNLLCDGDDEEPAYGYTGAVLFKSIPAIIGVIAGLIFGIIVNDYLSYIGISGAALVFLAMGVGALGFTIICNIVSSIYLKYWWYKQASRLKLNGPRYGLEINESGTDNILFHTLAEVFFIPITIVLVISSLLIPGIIVGLLVSGAVNSFESAEGLLTFASIIVFICCVLLALFGHELTVGSNYSMMIMFKNLSRFSDAATQRAADFDPMGYEYYPSYENYYPEFLPKIISGDFSVRAESEEEYEESPKDTVIETSKVASIMCIKGDLNGYKFPLVSGEEIIIGKDAKEASIVINPTYKEISRKHVGIRYDILSDTYTVIDYSLNGTFANNNRLEKEKHVILQRGTIIKLANDKNVFRLE